MYFCFMYASIFLGDFMTNHKLKIKYNELLSEYSQGMNKAALAYIRENFWKLKDSIDIPDILMQVYSELDIFRDNVYLKHLDRIKNIFDIKCNVLEIGGGMLPAFSNMLASEQLKLGKGKVTVYDPMLATTNSKHSNMKLVKEPFNLNTEIKDFDLVIGIMPCDATEAMVKKVCQNKKDFYLFMCGCTHFTYDQILAYGLGSKSYQKYIIDLIESMINDKVNIDTFESRYELDYPILYKKF